MMKGLMIIGISLLLTSSIMAQGKRFNGEKVEKLKIAFLTEELNLSVEESQLFWPVYNEYQQAKKEMEVAQKGLMKEIRELKEPQDSDVSKAIIESMGIKKELANAEEKYLHQSLAVLGAKKTLKLVRSEKKFRERLLDDIRSKRSESGGQQHRRPGGNR